MLIRLLVIAFLIFLIYAFILRAWDSIFGSPRKNKRRSEPTERERSNAAQEAAVAMMIAIGRDGGSLSEEAKTAIFGTIRDGFSMVGREADRLYGHAHELIPPMLELLDLFKHFSGTINKNCDYSQKKQLYSMLFSVATIDNPNPSANQVEALELLTELLDIGPQYIGTQPGNSIEE